MENRYDIICQLQFLSFFLLPLNRRLFFNPAKWLVFKTVRQGAQTQIRLAVDPELECVSGKYFADCRECVPSKAARDADTAEWLWRRSEEMTQLSVVLGQDSLIVR